MSRVWDKTPKAKGSTLRPFSGEVVPLEIKDELYFNRRYEIDVATAAHHIRVAPTTNRYVLPIYSPEGWWRGVVLRTPWPEAPRKLIETTFSLPKADTFMSRHEPVQSFYRAEHGDHSHLVIVEDQLSAIKLVDHGHDAVAVLGTPYSKWLTSFADAPRIAELAREAGSRETIVAFDADATDQAFEFVRKWGPTFQRIRVAILDMDLKDTPYNEFRGILGV